MNLKPETIDVLKTQIDLCEKYDTDKDAASWGYEEGVLISVNQAKEILSALEGYHKTEWVSCEDRLPNTNDTVLTYTNYRRTVFTTYYFAKQWDTYHFNYEDETPTHWMPLPPAPNTNK